jgi:DNA replication and repair protein RecF
MLQTINLENFRNHHLKSFDFAAPGTVIVGPNGVGKTNLLEAIYISSLTRSYRGNDSMMLRHKHHYFRVESGYKDGIASLGYSEMEPSHTKQATWQGKKIPFSKLIGLHPVVLFEPNQTQLFSETPSNRRRYLDTVLSQVDPNYLVHARTYRKLIMQRNKLLESYPSNPTIQEQIMIYTIQLIDPICYLVKKRQQFLKLITKDINWLYQQITSTTAKLITKYQVTIDIESDIPAQYSNILSREQRAKRTLLGPHRDDFGIEVDGLPVQEVSSRGELRATLLALKYSEYQYIKSVTKHKPILLFDDVLSEFDPVRQKRFLQTNFDGQLIITTTELPTHLTNLGVIEL